MLAAADDSKMYKVMPFRPWNERDDAAPAPHVPTKPRAEARSETRPDSWMAARTPAARLPVLAYGESMPLEERPVGTFGEAEIKRIVRESFDRHGDLKSRRALMVDQDYGYASKGKAAALTVKVAFTVALCSCVLGAVIPRVAGGVSARNDGHAISMESFAETVGPNVGRR